MNVGRDHKKALEWAKANAKLTNQIHYLHIYNGVYWLGKDKVQPPYTEVKPNGTHNDHATTQRDYR